MSSRSRNHGRRDERPTLPPIRDLFQDLRAPHDSSSLTLARLRVSDEPNDSFLAYVPDSFTPRTSGDQPLGRSPELPPSEFAEHQYQYHHHRNAHVATSHQSNLEGRWSPVPFPGHALHPTERRSGDERHSSPPPASQGWSSQTSLRRNTFDASGYPNGHKTFPYPDVNPRSRLSFDVSYQGHSHIKTHPSRLGEIVTSVALGPSFDDEQTPVARYGSPGPSSLPPKASEDRSNTGSTVSKYECSYCGKGFNRPSSLKIHLNSHTGEKPFVCPVENCGRSFSVLSNMRRHARVHSQIPTKQLELSSDEDSENSATFQDPSPVSASAADLTARYPPYGDVSTHRWNQRRDSSASTSSGTSSRRSHGHSSDERTDVSARPEKRLRGRPE